jgi:hypothetical protein
MQNIHYFRLRVIRSGTPSKHKVKKAKWVSIAGITWDRTGFTEWRTMKVMTLIRE